ncbi:methionyl-tRNA formyltransferase [Candidatus Sumerlaeota bacterium]|nr:methionyl-tRNA formyltransferase [Candidatus Sumerlaeota bacterium]
MKSLLSVNDNFVDPAQTMQLHAHHRAFMMSVRIDERSLFPERAASLRVLFFGTPDFAVPTLLKLLESGHEVVGVVTRADKPTGRGRKITAPPVKEVAVKNNLTVFQPENIKTNEFADELVALKPDVAVVVAYGKILPKRILGIPRFGCLNIHASLLPAYRGAAPIQWAIVRGERKTGVTIMQMNEGLDTGPIIATEEVDILDDDDAISLANMLSYAGAGLLVETLTRIERDQKVESTPQDDAGASLAPLIRREMARIDWAMKNDDVICAIRGFVAWPKAFTTLGTAELKITGAEGWNPNWVPSTAFDKRIAPGTVIELVAGRGIVVRTGGDHGLVLLTRVQMPGGPEMSAQDFVNGGGIDVGTILGK